VVEVSNYVAALDHGLARLREGFPLSSRLIREIHAVLLARGRGSGRELASLGVARELTGKRRKRLFAYDRYLAILNEGTEAPTAGA
jgi:hypothetical protein